MAVSYKGLWKMLIDRELKKVDIRTELGISSSTFAKMTKNQYVSLELLDRMSEYLNCDIGDLVERIPKKKEWI